jgi:sterol desaturase/sphingolipid hydroxylase (fatty acid hydroxylase superfamily)
MFLLVFAQLIIYFVYGYGLGVIEQMDFVKYKNQIRETVIKLFIFNTIPRYIFYLFIDGNLSIPKPYDFIVNLILYTFVQDVLFWIIHRLIHLEPFYTLIHKQHHSIYETHTYGIFGKYMSSLDFVSFELLNMPLKMIFFDKSIVSMCIIDYIDYVMTISSHSVMFKSDAHHQIHHRYQEYNFGITPFTDTFFKTLYKKIEK